MHQHLGGGILTTITAVVVIVLTITVPIGAPEIELHKPEELEVQSPLLDAAPLGNRHPTHC